MDAQQASVELTKLINGYQISQVIHVAAQLGIADLLKDGPRPAAQVAEATDSHAGSMYRLLRALTSVGVLEEQRDAGFSLTEIGQCLRSDSPHSRVAWARYIGRPNVWRSWGEMRHSVATGEDAFRHLHGTGVWDWRAERPEETAIFDAAMTEMSRGAVDAIAGAFDFSSLRRIVDVGGGQGVLLSGILSRHKDARGILLDLPHVVVGAAAVLEANGVADRCEVIGGNMFSTLPQGADAYILKNGNCPAASAQLHQS